MIEASFGNTQDRKIVWAARNNLKHVRYVNSPEGSRISNQWLLNRDLINEICKWGWARLVRDTMYPSFLSANQLTQNDGRWSGLVNGLAIADEIRVFNEKLMAAKGLLSVCCHLFQRNCRNS